MRKHFVKDSIFPSQSKPLPTKYFTTRFLLSTFNPILTMPVNTDTFENSTELKISILSENNFCMLLRRLESKAVLKEKKRELFKEMNLLHRQEKQRTKEKQ